MNVMKNISLSLLDQLSNNRRSKVLLEYVRLLFRSRSLSAASTLKFRRWNGPCNATGIILEENVNALRKLAVTWSLWTSNWSESTRTTSLSSVAPLKIVIIIMNKKMNDERKLVWMTRVQFTVNNVWRLIG